MKPHDLSSLEAALGHRFVRPELIEQALTHSSHAHESAAGEEGGALPSDNEQLEFLGDAVLGFVTSQELFERFPEYHEGQLSKLRAHLVSAQHLQEVAARLDLGRYLRLGRGEEKSGGRSKAALLVNALEALLAAVYLDGGVEPARQFVVRHIVEPGLEGLGASATEAFPVTDYKSTLQELLQAEGRQLTYELVREEGPEHKKTFTVELSILPTGSRKPDYRARATGPTKKKAEQKAARQAVERMTEWQTARTPPDKT